MVRKAWECLAGWVATAPPSDTVTAGQWWRRNWHARENSRNQTHLRNERVPF
jgi:hypothetical protein